MDSNHKLLIASFDTEHALLDAAWGAREKGIQIHDAYTPYAVHGLEEAMGLKRTRLTFVCFAFGLTGLAVALAFQLWTFMVDWPLNVGGKSFSALPALIPITFETCVLFAALGTVATFFARTCLWPGKRPQLVCEGVTDDRFAIVLQTSDAEMAAVREFIGTRGALEVKEVEPDS